MDLDETKKAIAKGSFIGVLVVIIGILGNLAQFLDWMGISPKTNPTESTFVAETSVTTDNSKDYFTPTTEPLEAEQPIIISMTALPETEPPTESETDAIAPPPNYEPKVIKLTDLDYFYSNHGFSISDYKDNLGNFYSEVLSTYTGGFPSGYTQYYLNKKYGTLSGTTFLTYETRSANDETIVEFRGDGIVLETFSFTGGVLPQEFSIDITDVEVLEVSYHSGVDALVCIDATLTKAQ